MLVSLLTSRQNMENKVRSNNFETSVENWEKNSEYHEATAFFHPKDSSKNKMQKSVLGDLLFYFKSNG